MDDDVDQIAHEVRAVDARILVAMACAAAERFLPVYEAVGSGDPNVLRETLAALKEWVASGATPTAAQSHKATLEEYVAAYYDDGDELLGGIVAATLVPLEVYEARTVQTKRGEAVGRAFSMNADLSDLVDVAIGGSDADVEEGLWRTSTKNLGLAGNLPNSNGEPGWMSRLVASLGE